MKRSGSRFGLTDDQWDTAKGQVRSAIIEAAALRKMTCYSDVASSITAVHVDPYSALMNHLLGAVFEDERSAGRPALTSIVTHKNGDLEPGSGFYDEARVLGYSFDNKTRFEFWAAQVQEVFKLHGR
jgi:hypothetical protein